MTNSTLSIIANIHAHNNILTPSTTIMIEIRMVNAIFPLLFLLILVLIVV